MKILHLLSQFELTGAESYAVTLANHQMTQGHAVWIFSDTLRLPTTAQVQLRPIGNRRWPQRLKTVRALREFLRSEKIDLVHAHSRAASWVAFFATRGLPVPLVSTVHGRQHLHTSVRLFSVYGDQVIPVCKNLQAHLQTEVGLSPSILSPIPNVIDFSRLLDTNLQPTTAVRPYLLWFGRTSGPKGERLGWFLEVFAQLKKRRPELTLRLLGGTKSQLPRSYQQQLAAWNAQDPECCTEIAYTTAIAPWLLGAEAVVASGRAAMEALVLQRPTFVMGEGTTVGWISTAADLTQAIDTNFGDILPRQSPWTTASVAATVASFWAPPKVNSENIKKTILQHYDLHSNAIKIHEAYFAALLHKHRASWIPTLMYHKVPERPLTSRHKIYITRRRFAQHLRWLRWLGFQTLHFRELLGFMRGQTSFWNFPSKPIFLTFDDGYEDNLLHALPLLRQAKMKATLFLLATAPTHNHWDTEQDPSEPPSKLLSLAQRQQLVPAIFEIGSHGMSHQSFCTLSPAQRQQELQQSKLDLEKEFGTAIEVFAYPYGAYQAPHPSEVQAAGYLFAVSTDQGVPDFTQNRFALFRINIFPNDGLVALFKKTSRWYPQYFFAKREKKVQKTSPKEQKI